MTHARRLGGHVHLFLVTVYHFALYTELHALSPPSAGRYALAATKLASKLTFPFHYFIILDCESFSSLSNSSFFILCKASWINSSRHILNSIVQQLV